MEEKTFKKFFNREFFYINSILFERQKNILIVIFFIITLLFYIKPETKAKYSPKDLKIDINKATKEELINVPYIGKKTADKIIEMRRKLGSFESINQLKNIRNFKKFKKYIKVENKH